LPTCAGADALKTDASLGFPYAFLRTYFRRVGYRCSRNVRIEGGVDHVLRHARSLAGSGARPRGARRGVRRKRCARERRRFPMEAVIETRGLKKRYGAVAALDGVSLAVRRGAVLGVVGDNGAGKSTLFKV